METRYAWAARSPPSSPREALSLGVTMNTTKKMPVSNWLDFTLIAVGFWLLFSPAFLHFNSENPENWIASLAGMVVLVPAFALRHSFRAWSAWSVAVVGAVMIPLPWVAGFDAGPTPTLNVVICGLITLAAAVGRWYAHAKGLDQGPAAPTPA